MHKVPKDSLPPLFLCIGFIAGFVVVLAIFDNNERISERRLDRCHRAHLKKGVSVVWDYTKGQYKYESAEENE